MNRNDLRILMVEDDPDDEAILRGLLRECCPSAEICCETLLALAIRRLREQTFDLAFLDLSLPDSIGMATVERFRTEAPKLPLVVMTGATLADLAEDAKRRGASDCLPKLDLEPERIRTAVETALAGR